MDNISKEELIMDAEAEIERQEVEKWQESRSHDSFDIWKMKEYVDERIMQWIIGTAIGLVIVSFLIKYF